MKSKSQNAISTILILLSCVFTLTSLNSADAQPGDYDYLSDRVSREHRQGGEVDDWHERGNSMITASPQFEGGVRLTAWGSEHDGTDEGYDFAIASAVYFFEIPAQAQYAEISVRYRGEQNQPIIEDYEPIAGRVWIRNTKRELTRRTYDDKHADETRYGDTFVLRAKRRSETIKIPTAGHLDDGFLEVHIVAEDGQELDIEYIDVASYRRRPHVPVYHRYVRSYDWRPWHNYTYLYFYDGPFYYATDDYYIRWSYPIYDHHYLSIRYSFGNYLHSYYTYRPRYYHRSYSRHANVYVDTHSHGHGRTRLNQWSAQHETVRGQYTRSRSSGATRTVNRNAVQNEVRSVLDRHQETQRPFEVDSVRHNSIVTLKRKRLEPSTGVNATIERQRQVSTPYRRNDTGSSSLSKTRRYSVDSYRTKSDDYTRSNDERRTRLYDQTQPYQSRSRISTSRSSTSSSNRSTSTSPSSSTKQRRSDTSSSYSSRQRSTTSSAPSSRSRSSTTEKTRSSRSSSSSSSSSDDDDQESQRSKSTERTKRRR